MLSLQKRRKHIGLGLCYSLCCELHKSSWASVLTQVWRSQISGRWGFGGLKSKTSYFLFQASPHPLPHGTSLVPPLPLVVPSLPFKFSCHAGRLILPCLLPKDRQHRQPTNKCGGGGRSRGHTIWGAGEGRRGRVAVGLIWASR